VSQLPSGWTPVGGMTFAQLLLRRGAPFAAREAVLLGVVAFGGVQFVFTGPEDRELWLSAAVGIGVTVIGLIVAIAVAAERSPTPYLNFDTDELRVRRRTVLLRDIDEAWAWSINWGGEPDRFLRFGVRGGPTASVRVLSSDLPVLAGSERELVAEAIRRSGVVLPEAEFDRYDPTGRFSRSRHPNSLTRDEAVEYVLHTPDDGEPVHRPRPESTRRDEQ
jgi:hypothetical protein